MRRALRRLLRVALTLALLPLLVVPGWAPPNARASYGPAMDALLLANGYAANVVDSHGLRVLRASQRSYADSLWARDLDYAISGYAYVLSDMAVFRASIELLLAGTGEDGVVPETIYLDPPRAENRQSWDSMPNLVHAVYVYVAKTGDRAFYQAHRATLLRVGAWIAGLDSDGDGLPDRDIFPYGYYDSIRGGVLHTYALAKCYTAFRELAELERYDGRDGASWDRRAARLRDGFQRPVARGGYWRDGLAWPIAWRRADGGVEPLLETFGVFEALRSGLIDPSDGQRYYDLLAALHRRLPELIDGPAPLRLALGGYPLDALRPVEPPVPRWMLDASAPWIVGPAALAYAAGGYPADSAALLRAYAAAALAGDPPLPEFVAGPRARYGAGASADRGRAWDSAAWFMAVYGGHYGLTLTPAALIVQPRPFGALPDDGVRDLTYQGARIQLALDAPHMTYRIEADRAVAVLLRPLGGAARLQLNGGAAREQVALELQPGREYVVTSQGSITAGSTRNRGPSQSPIGGV